MAAFLSYCPGIRTGPSAVLPQATQKPGTRMIFRQLFDQQSSTYTYLLADAQSRDALLIDPVFEQARRDVALVEELGLNLRWTLETHVHADHVTGAWLLRERLGSRIELARASDARRADRYLQAWERVQAGSRFVA